MTVRFSASVAARLMACPASADLAKAIPGWIAPVEDRTANNAANRGTAKHEMLEPIMKLSAREVQQLADYLQYVADLRKTRRFNVLVEEPVVAEWLASRPSTTADLVLYTQDEIHVIDGKWGKIPVPVIDNAQLLYYGVCYAPLAPRAKGVTFHVLQPPLDKYESWYADAVTLKQFMADAQMAEAKVLAGDVTFGPSDHCTFCPAYPHSRTSAKGSPLCPATLQLLYPRHLDEDEILSL